MYVIEFQKRGLPHCHILIILKNEYKLKSIEQINKAIWAEIPDKESYPKLHKRVLNHIIHMPCNTAFVKCKKVFGGKCSKQFPKDYQQDTILEVDSYPLYKRRINDSVCVKEYGRNKIPIDNRFVVPYNPYLPMKYNAHINVEVCNTVMAVKYLYKYIYKGYDKAMIDLNPDECERYVNSRYVSSIEAYWRLKGYKMHGRIPAVFRMPVHEEHCESVY